MLQLDGMVLVMMMMTSMKSSSIVMMMAMNSPLRGGISLADFCLPASFLSLSVFSAPQRRQSLSLIPPSVLGFRG
jgi:hypothetical protein